MHKFEPVSLTELKKKRKSILKALNKNNNSSIMGKLALWITESVGSMGFFLIIFTWTVGWLAWNTLGPHSTRFDPYPGFVLWLFISNMIQLFLMPLIMLGQNVQAKKSEIRSDVDEKINDLAEFENEAIIVHLEYQNKIMEEILENIKRINKVDTMK